MSERTVRRLPPCPAYDVEGMESWLTDLAREDGLFLVQDGIFAGVAEFEVGQPRQDVKYRLEAAPRSTGFLSDNGGDPDPEAVELNREFSWEYAGKRGNFYIYRTDDPTARELNTDPEVQAMAVSAVRKRQAGNVFYLLFWLAVHPLLRLAGGGGLLRGTVQLGTWFCLWAAALVVWILIDGVVELVYLRRLIKKLNSGSTPEQKKPWRECTVPYQARRLVQIILIVAWVIAGLNLWSASTEREQSLEAYRGTVPFATLKDFGSDYHLTMPDWSTVEEWSDWLAPRNVKWHEQAGFQISEGASRGTGGLEVEYHEMAAPFLARWMARELTPRPGAGPYYQVLELPPLDMDYAAASTDVFPTVVLQKGNKVLKASFYQTSGEQLELAEWVTVLANSLDT